MPKAAVAPPEFKLPFPKAETMEERAANGMALLDAKLGEAWPVMVDLQTFNINDGSRCVIGQVIGKATEWDEMYTGGINAITTDLNRQIQDLLFEVTWPGRGTTGPSPDDDNSKKLAWATGFWGSTAVSNDVWRKLIRERQIAIAGSVSNCTKARKQWAKKQEERRRARLHQTAR